MTRLSRRAFLAGAVFGVYAAAGTSLAWPMVDRRRMSVFAHHGDLDNWPENTLEALAAAMAIGPDGIEFDVDRSADGTFWLAHDHWVDAKTDGSGLLAELHDDEILNLTIAGGDGFDPARHTGLRMPTLAKALDVLEPWAGQVMVDLKTPDLVAHQDLMAQLVPRVDPDRTLVRAQSVEGASAVKAADRRFRTLLLTRVATWHPDVDIWLANAAQLTWPASALADLFGDVCAYVGTDYWPRDETSLLESARDRGVAMFITNHLAATLAWRGERSAARPGAGAADPLRG